MRRSGLEPLARAKRRVVADARADPYLPIILALATVLAGFWFWHLIPNFATRDERNRLFHPLVTFGTYLADPGFESAKEGILWSRVPYGATFYLFGLALLPVIAAAFLTGQLDIFLAFEYPAPWFGLWPPWHGTPEWVWTWSILLVRLFNVLFAVGAVYLTYRIGVTLRDRTTGRLAAVLLTLTFGFLVIAHEGGEDMPALFFVLLALYLALHYVHTGNGTSFLAGCAAGGLAIGFKLTAAPVVLVIGAAFLLRPLASGSRGIGALLRPGLFVGGAVVGAATTLASFPTVFLAGIDPLAERLLEGAMSRTESQTGPDAPVWWWFLRGYLNAFGLPLFAAVVAGAVASLSQLRDRATSTAGIALVLTGLVTYLVMFSRWHDFRVHHLLPTFPLLVLLLGAVLAGLDDRAPSLARVVTAGLLVTGGAYAVVGTAGYADQPRDAATAWLNANAPRDATIEVHRRDFQDAAIPHWMDVNYVYGAEEAGEELDPCPRYIQLGYRDLLYLKPGTYYRNGDAQAEYIRSLLEGEYAYEIAAEFGPRPAGFVPDRPTPGSASDLLRVGLVPRTDQYADEQELGPNQYTVILARTGPCDRSRDPPFSIDEIA